MKKITLFLFSFFCMSVYAQQWQWLKKIPYDRQTTLKTAIDGFGNIYMVAEIDSPAWNIPTHFIYKLDTNGTVLTQQIFPINLYIDDLEINSQNQLMITGYFYDTLQFGSAQFISNGSEDIFIGAFTANLQFVWGKGIGGQSYDRGYAIAIDNNDNFFLCGRVADTLNFDGTILNCNTTGNSFVARFNLTGQLDWVIKDSTDIMYPNTYSYASDIIINNNNELLITGRFDYISYFFLNGLALTIPPLDPYGYNYGYSYAIKLDLDGNAAWGQCIKKPKWNYIQFNGLTSANSVLLNSEGYANEYHSSITLLDNNGTYYKTISVDSVIQGESWTNYLATINDQIYLLVSSHYYDSLGQHQPNYICTITNDELVIIDSINGQVQPSFDGAQVRECSLLKNSNDEYYISGIFSETLCAGNDTIKTDSIGNYQSQYNYYAYNPFIAKFTIPLTSGITSATIDLNNFQVFPNPSTGIFTVNLHNSHAEAKVTVRDVLGNCLLEKNCRGETSQEINLSCQPRGIYFVQLLSGEERVVKKVAVQ